MRPFALTGRRHGALGCTALLALLASQPGCSSQPTAKDGASSGERRLDTEDTEHLDEIRRALILPSELPHLLWRQKLAITAEGKTYQLEAIVQSDGEQFQVLALGPGGMKLFLVSFDEGGAKTQVFVQRTLSLSPEYLLFDIQRALFWKPAQLCSAVDSVWNFRGFRIFDSCRDGLVVKRKVSDGPVLSAHFGEQLMIEYSPGFDFNSAPTGLRLTHLSRGYQIDIVQLESHQLP